MAKVNLDKPAPDFELADFSGKAVRLSDYRGKSNVLLVFNRGFT
jgi:peroxiredoxin